MHSKNRPGFWMQNERGGNAEKVGNAGGEERSEVDCGRHEGAVVV